MPRYCFRWLYLPQFVVLGLYRARYFADVYVQSCSVVEGGKYGCIERVPIGQPSTSSRTYTNTAFDVVFTDVGELKTHNNAAIGSTATMAWQIVSVSGAMIIGALAAV